MKPKVNEIRKEYRKGPVCVRLAADKDAVSIAESVLLTIEAEVEEGFEAELPQFGEKLGEFGIRDYREDPPRLTPEGKVLTRKIYTLDPFLSGDYTIAPMQVRFRKQADGSARSGNQFACRRPHGSMRSPRMRSPSRSIHFSKRIRRN